MTPRAALRLLQSEIVQVVGCTEPAAVAFAFRTLVRQLPAPPPPRASPRVRPTSTCSPISISAAPALS